LPRYICTDHTGPHGDPAVLAGDAFVPAVPNYYQTDPISRASRTMELCTETYVTPALMAAE
jgi:NADH-quinone oxidoreductase subunit G